MLRLFAASLLLLLQLPAPTYGLPSPLRRATDAAASGSGGTGIAQSSGAQHPVAFTQDDEDGDFEPSASESDLARELADLSALQRQLAELQWEVHARQRWLADAAGLAAAAAAGSDSAADCDAGAACLVRTLLRKTRHAAAAVFYGDGGSGDGPLRAAEDGTKQTTPSAIKIPLPPWRQPQNGTGPDADHRATWRTSTWGANGDADTDVDSGDTDSGFDPVALTLAFAVFLCALVTGHQIRKLKFDVGYGGADGSSLPLTEERPGWRDGPRERRHCRLLPRFPNPFVGAGEHGRWWRGQQAGVADGLEDTARAASVHDEYADEKRGEEDEKARRLDGTDVQLLSESESESEIDGEDEQQQEEEEESLTLGEELASFRAALEMVEGIVAAEEGRLRERAG